MWSRFSFDSLSFSSLIHFFSPLSRSFFSLSLFSFSNCLLVLNVLNYLKKHRQQVSWKNCVACKMHIFTFISSMLLLLLLLLLKNEIVKTKHGRNLIDVLLEPEPSGDFYWAWFIWIQWQTCVTITSARWLIYGRIFGLNQLLRTNGWLLLHFEYESGVRAIGKPVSKWARLTLSWLVVVVIAKRLPPHCTYFKPMQHFINWIAETVNYSSNPMNTWLTVLFIHCSDIKITTRTFLRRE